jgi:hypothetical protein
MSASETQGTDWSQALAVGVGRYEIGNKPMITHQLANCVAIAAYNPATKQTVFAHYDTGQATKADYEEDEEGEEKLVFKPDEKILKAVKQNMERQLQGNNVQFSIALGGLHDGSSEILNKFGPAFKRVFQPTDLLGPGSSAGFDPASGKMTSWDRKAAPTNAPANPLPGNLAPRCDELHEGYESVSTPSSRRSSVSTLSRMSALLGKNSPAHQPSFDDDDEWGDFQSA